LISRNSSEELRTVAGALLQAHELGTPSGKTLQDQSEDMRVRRIQRAKEEGAKASPKITLVTTIMVAPAVMGLFLAIVACKVVQNLGPLMKEFIGR
jgi:tight adherence protein C